MAIQTQGGIFERYGQHWAKAFNKAKTQEITVPSYGELPAGLSGIARLCDLKFDKVKEGKKNAGEYFFYIAGTVLEPSTFTDEKGNVHRVAGLRTSITEMMCATPDATRKTPEDHMIHVMQILGRLGMKIEQFQSPRDLENMVAAWNVAVKKKEKPLNVYFSFSTFKGQKQTTGKYAGKEPMTNHIWREVLPDYKPTNIKVQSVAEPEVNQDEETDNYESEEQEETSVSKASKASANGKHEQEKQEEDFRDDDDLNSLAERAENGDKVARNKLTEFAVKAGISKKKVADADHWSEVVEMITEATSAQDENENSEEQENEEEQQESEEEEQEQEQEEQQEPEVDNVVNYHPLNKEGKPMKNPVECTILKVNTKAKTVDIQNMSSQKVYKNVSWSAIANTD